MRRLILILILPLVAVSAMAADYYATAAKASHAYKTRDWPTAQAMYELMLDERPDSGSVYSRTIIASAMRSDTVRAMQLIELASAHGVSIYGLFDQIRNLSYELGKPHLYSQLLEMTAREMRWLSRPVDAALLEFYTKRRNGPMMIEYARRMLKGMPDSPDFLSALAKGLLLTGQYDEAIATWREALTFDPDNYTTLLELGNLLLIQDKPSEGLPYLVRAYRINPTPYVANILRSNMKHLGKNPTQGGRFKADDNSL